ncbi:MAG: c-type cytochrome [Ignavibacteria bacterium]|nr:c-type cytochrome [Ignavibacteria bacterium]
MLDNLKELFNFKKRLGLQIENRNYTNFYLIISIILFLSTAWAVIDEVITRRPWKDYQSEYNYLLQQKLQTNYDELISFIDSSTVAGLHAELKKAESSLENEAYKNAVEELGNLQQEFVDATREWSFARSKSDAVYYEYKKGVHGGSPSQSLKDELKEIERSIAEYADSVSAIQNRINKANEFLATYTNKIAELNSEIKKIFIDADKVKLKLTRASAAQIEIKQVVIDDFEKTNFSELKARVDRCQTCHLGSGEPLMADAPQPFTTHPLPELLKIHNPEKFGCTTCHRGQGNALTAGFAHGDEDHYWETPLLKKTDVYASCNSCHANQNALKSAPYFTKAKQVMLEVGCYACHQIDGYENLRPIGPELKNVSSKVKPEWVYQWVLNPKSYNPNTRMPDYKFLPEEAEAVTAFLFDKSKNSNFKFANFTGSYKGGSSAKGKLIFNEVGCQACHVIGGETKVREKRNTSYDIAPELSHVSGKLSPDFIYDWIKNPRHYNPTTRMPNLRLTDSEARDIVAYLQTMSDSRNKDSRKLEINKKEKIDFGEKLVRSNGCYGCHAIEGMERESKISVNLSDFGRKKVEQMDFGDVKELDKHGEHEFEIKDGKVAVQHSWAGWVYGKSYNSRLFQTERIPQKMPVFNLGDEEIKLLRMLLLSYRNDKPNKKYQQTFDQRIRDLDQGQKLITGYACINCHEIEDHGSYFSATLEDPSMGPPMITMEGAKVQEPWLNEFIKSPSPIRPWLKVRMPTFSLSENEINDLTKYFLAVSKQELRVRDYSAFQPNKSTLAEGKLMFDSYQCLKCHILGKGESSGSLGPDLSLTAKRLKPEWVVDWLKDPQVIQPGTMMPGYFPDGQTALPDVLEGDAKKQMEAIRDHVFIIGKNKK